MEGGKREAVKRKRRLGKGGGVREVKTNGTLLEAFHFLVGEDPSHPPPSFSVLGNGLTWYDEGSISPSGFCVGLASGEAGQVRPGKRGGGGWDQNIYSPRSFLKRSFLRLGCVSCLEVIFPPKDTLLPIFHHSFDLATIGLGLGTAPSGFLALGFLSIPCSSLLLPQYRKQTLCTGSIYLLLGLGVKWGKGWILWKMLWGGGRESRDKSLWEVHEDSLSEVYNINI